MSVFTRNVSSWFRFSITSTLAFELRRLERMNYPLLIGNYAEISIA